METIELLKKLTSSVGVSGAENEIKDTLYDILSKIGTVSTDSVNNVYCTFGSGYHILLDAHIDEIGLIVTSITDDGFVKFDKCGGIDTRMLLGYEVEVLGKERIFGVISTLPPHLMTAEDEKKVPKIKDLSIDTGYDAKTLKSLISPGDRIIFKRNFTKLVDSQISASCLDDRSGVAAIILAAKKIKENLPNNCKITVLCSSQEEVGTRGAKVAPFAKNIDEAISVDVSFAYTPGCDKDDCGNIGDGAMIGISPILDKSMTDKLVSIAKAENIPYQLEIMNGQTGTNADVITVCESGIKTALLSIPEKYMHSPVEVVDTNDINSVAKLISRYVIERVGELNA